MSDHDITRLFQLAGIPENPLLREFPWRVPQDCFLVETEDGPALDWKGKRWGEAKTDGVRRRFSELRDAEPRDVVAFASLHGNLWLCREHEALRAHRALNYPPETPERCTSLKPEPVSLWRSIAHKVYATEVLAGELELARKNPARTGWKDEDLWWRFIFGEPLRRDLFDAGPELGKMWRYFHRTQSLERARQMIGGGLRECIRRHGVGLDYGWSPDDPRPRLEIQGLGLLGFIYRDLALAVARIPKLFFCDACGQPFTPGSNYTPRANQRVLCSDRCRAEANRLRQQKYRERQKRKRSRARR